MKTFYIYVIYQLRMYKKCIVVKKKLKDYLLSFDGFPLVLCPFLTFGSGAFGLTPL